MHLTVLDKDTELASTVLASSPRILRIVATVLIALLAATAIWAFATSIDLVVKTTSRVRTATSPLTDFNAASGDALTVAIAGQVASLDVTEGQAVAKDAVLMRLDTRRLDNDIERLRRQVDADSEELRRSAALLDELADQQAKATAKASASIAETEQALRGERERHQLEQQVRQAEQRLLEIDVAKHQDHFDRLAGLVATGVVSRREVASAEFALRTAKSQLEKTRIPDSDASVLMAERRVTTSRSDLDLLIRQMDFRRKELEVQQSRRAAEIDSLRRSMDNLLLDRAQCDVRCPFDGIVSTLRVQVGQVIQPGQPVAFIVDQSGYRIDALVSSADIGQIKPGMPARVKLDAFDYQRFGSLQATVTHVGTDSELTEAGAFYVVRMALEHPGFANGARVKLGMTGLAEITVDRERLLWLVFNRGKKAAGL
ncbi:MAG: HlyD family efflux transporter periplasmic adaptor subunit [Planctomycetes bacterium]|nr:HlyD family efflux transporter periplasmic adaptor subunit [Planctomycetota bacterium]